MNGNLKFEPRNHKKYFLRTIQGLPPVLGSMDTQRMILLYFSISGLDLLNELDNSIPEEKKKSIINWIYSLQITNDIELVSGFQGSTTLNTRFNKSENSEYKWGHIATTYSALCTLLILGDNLERVNRDSIVKTLRTLQLPNGCYKATKEGTEDDMRFVYCAACISYILDDWSGMDIERSVNFIVNSMSYDCGIAQGPELESHGGSTFCAIATLALTKQLYRLSNQQRHGIIRWLLNRLANYGFAGRPNKAEDTCYSYWTGGALKILDAYHFIEADSNIQFVLATQDRRGGFSKWINTAPDPLHTYLGLAGLSFMKQPGIADVYPHINISVRAHEHLKHLHETWRK